MKVKFKSRYSVTEDEKEEEDRLTPRSQYTEEAQPLLYTILNNTIRFSGVYLMLSKRKRYFSRASRVPPTLVYTGQLMAEVRETIFFLLN